MNKRDLKEALHARLEENGFSSPSMAQTSRNVDYLFEIISESLAKGDDVAIQGIGTLSVVNRASRKGRNVRTGEEIMIPERKAIRFKVSKTLKNRIN